MHGNPHDAVLGLYMAATNQNLSNGSLEQQGRTKRVRTSFKNHQLRVLKQYFQLNHNPDAKELKQLSQKTGLSKRVLQVIRLPSLFSPQNLKPGLKQDVLRYTKRFKPKTVLIQCQKPYTKYKMFLKFLDVVNLLTSCSQAERQFANFDGLLPQKEKINQ